LGELVLADHAAGVLAGGASLGAKTGRPSGETQGELRLVQDLLAHEVGERNLSGRNEPEAIRRLEKIFGELGQVSGAEGGVVAHEKGRIGLGIPELRRVQ